MDYLQKFSLTFTKNLNSKMKRRRNEFLKETKIVFNNQQYRFHFIVSGHRIIILNEIVLLQHLSF